jgi:hypothetical protein
MNITSSRSGRAVHIAAAAAVLGLVAGSAAVVSAAAGGGGDRDGGDGEDRGGRIHESLSGYEETPLALSTSGHGKFRATMTDEGISYTLSYDALEGAVSQAHIHFGATGQTGGVSVFLCSNLGNGPSGTPACPAAPGTVSGMVGPAGMVAATAAQGIDPGEYDELVAAIRAGSAYVNVHSGKYPGGEIRAQIDGGHEGHH